MTAFPAVLSDDEKSRIRMHMGYPDIQAAATFLLGFPATIETAYIIEVMMNQVREQALPQLRRILDVLDTFDLQDVDDLSVHVASRVGEIDVNHDEHKLIDTRYDRWLGRLENLIGCSRNPFDKRWAGSGPDSINRPVIG